MKVQVAELLKALQRTRAVVQPTAVVDIFEAVELEITEDALYLTTASQSISATVEIPIEAGDPDVAVIKLAPLYEMVRRWDGEATIASDGEHLLAKCKRSRPKFQLMEADHFRRITCPEEANAFTLTKAEIEHLLFKPQAAVKPDEFRTYLAGVCLQTKGDELRGVGTDGGVLIKHAIERPDIAGLNIILPCHAIDVLKKHLTADEPVQISIANGRARFAVSDGQVTTALINEKFPEYDQMLHRQGSAGQKLPLEEAIAVVDRVTCIGEDKMVGVYPHEEGVKVALVGKSTTKNSDIIPAEHPIDFTPIAFSQRLLGVALSSCSGDEIDLKFSGPEQPHFVAEPGDPRNIRMLMPARVRP